jgi:hypothetical protein
MHVSLASGSSTTGFSEFKGIFFIYYHKWRIGKSGAWIRIAYSTRECKNKPLFGMELGP